MDRSTVQDKIEKKRSPFFWTGYLMEKPIESSYWQLKSIFQLYYLLNWLNYLPLESEKNLEILSKQIKAICQQ